jgi:hypothetical protein
MVVHLYSHVGGGEYQNGESRKLAKESIINRLGKYPEWVVAEPINISFLDRRGRRQTLALISSVTAVESAWMTEIAPHLVSSKTERLRWGSEQNCVVEDHVTIFNGQEIAREQKPAPWSAEAFKIFVNAMMSTYTSSEVVNQLYRANTEILNQYNAYYVRSGGTIPKKDSEIIRGLYAKVLEPKRMLGFEQFVNSDINLDELMIKLSDLISQEEVAEIEQQNPEVIEVDGEQFSVSYSYDSWNGSFIAVITTTEDFIHEAKVEQILLPSGREVKLIFASYTQTLSEHRARIEKARLEEIERAKRNLVSNFENQISGSLTIPQELPFHTGWGATELGQVLQNRLQALKAEMIEGLTLENYAERVENVKTKAEEIKNEIRTQHENAQALIAKTEEIFEKTLAEVDQSFVRDEASQICNFIYEAKTSLQKGEFFEVENICFKTMAVINSLIKLSKERENKEINKRKEEEKEQLIANNPLAAALAKAGFLKKKN